MNKKLLELAKHDATVAKILTFAVQQEMTYTEGLELAIISLSEEKKTYFDELVKMKQRYGNN